MYQDKNAFSSFPQRAQFPDSGCGLTAGSIPAHPAQKAITEVAQQHECNLGAMHELEQRMLQTLQCLGVSPPPCAGASESASAEPSKGHIPEMRRVAQYSTLAMERLHSLMSELERCI